MLNLKEIQIQIKRYNKAVDTMFSGISSYNSYDDLKRDGILQRFEYTLELAWKTMKKLLEFAMVETNPPSPKNIIRLSKTYGIINDLNLWIDFLESRSVLSHKYDEDTADMVFDFVKENYKEFETLITSLNNFLDKNK